MLRRRVENRPAAAGDGNAGNGPVQLQRLHYGYDGESYHPDGEPLVPETQVVPLDLSRVIGEVVRIRLDPPRGLRDLDYAAAALPLGGGG